MITYISQFWPRKYPVVDAADVVDVYEDGVHKSVDASEGVIS
jgi:hypothetical protein